MQGVQIPYFCLGGPQRCGPFRVHEVARDAGRRLCVGEYNSGGEKTFKSNEFHVKKNVKRDVLLQDVAGRIANFASQTSSNYIVQCAIYGTSTTATSAVPGLLQCTDSEANAAQYLYPLLHLPSPPLFPPAFTYTNTILLQCIWSGKRGVSGRQFTQFTHHCRRMQCTNLISLALPISNLKSIKFQIT